MEFQVAFIKVLVTVLYIIPGYVVCKMKKATAEHLPSLSGVLIYVGSPFLVINAFLKLKFDPAELGRMGLYFVLSLSLQVLFITLLYLIFRKKYDDVKYRVLTIASVIGNVGFFGLPVLSALMPDHPEVLCYSTMNTLTMNILVFTMGVYCLTGEKKYMTLKAALLNPTAFGFVIAFPLYLSGLSQYLPEALTGAIGALSDMTAPLCMIILGIRLATVPLKKLFMRPLVYAACLGKLLIYPLFCFTLLYFLPIDQTLKASLVILAGTPCASVVLSLAEMHRTETELSANSVLLTTLLCFLTIPLLTVLV